MDADMSRATLKDKGQITLPAAIRRQLDARTGDLFEVELVGEKVIMTPQKLVSSGRKAKTVDLSRYMGAASGSFGSVAEIDAAIRHERDKWG